MGSGSGSSGSGEGLDGSENREIDREQGEGEDEPLRTQPRTEQSAGDKEPESARPDRDQEIQEGAKTQPPGSDTSHYLREDVAGRWGTLPSKVQEMLLQFESSRIPPKYRRLIEAYYRKVSEAGESGSESRDR